MGLSALISQMLKGYRKIDVNKLPSQGLFYKDDFKLWIKKAEDEDIKNYERNYRKSLESAIHRVKKIVKRNVVVAEGYSYRDIKSIDIIFLFFEIVQYTNKKDIIIKYFDDVEGTVNEAIINSEHFNYVKIPDNLMEKYDAVNKQFVIDGFKYSLPSIGIESSMVNFLIRKSILPENMSYQNYFYDFIYFLNDKTKITDDEMENLITIFNDDISEDDLEKIQNIILTFEKFWRYALKKDNQIISITNRVDLEKIWK